MSRQWTKEQLDAIRKEGTNIIVSAGAGSGKTAVLTERVIRKLKQGVNINKLLVLTFTKAAAHEMKERIRKSLIGDDSLKEQLSLLDSSYITTFDSFALSVVKKYHYLLNISSNVAICDSALLKMEKKSIIDNIFDELYMHKNPHYLKLISDFCVKDDRSIKEYILKINDKLDMKYDRDIYLDTYISVFFNDLKIETDIKDFIKVIQDRCNSIEQLLDKISFYVESDYYDKLETSLNPLLNSNNYNEYKSNLNINFPRLPNNTDDIVKAYRDNIKDIIKEINDMCLWDNDLELKDSIIKTKEYIDIIIYIIKEFDKQLKKYKDCKNVYEFNDIANLSIKLIKEDDDIRNELKNTFHEILVDEYQDTNDLQEGFVSLISNNNVYMVGDIKQSIYRFRNANPNIFMHKYERYKHSDEGIKIDLNKNFRSRSEVLNNINLIFDSLMDLTLGGADYKKEHRLESGNMLYLNEGKTDQNNNLEIYNYTYDKDLGFKKEELEIFLIANDIRNKIDNHYQVMDKDKGILRTVTYSDFAILLDRSNHFDLYKKIFTYMKIPIIIHKEDSIATTSDIFVIRSILKLINYCSRKQFDNDFKYAFMSVGRSFLFEYNDNDLFDYITNDNYKETKLYQKAMKISKKLNALSIDALLELIVSEFNIYENIIKIGNIDDMIGRIDYLIETAKVLSLIGYSLDDFISYLDDNFNDKSDIKLSLNKDDSDACQIMTIHKSKGLEFNICYYANLYAGFNIRDLNELFYYDSLYGIIVPYFNEGINNTFYKTLLKEKYIKEEIEEKIRLFYVALSRCREKMIMIVDLDTNKIYDKDEEGLIELSSRLGYRSFRDIILSVKESLTPFIRDVNIEDIELSLDYNIKVDSDYSKRIPKTSIVIENDLIKIDSKPLKEASYSKKINELLDEDTLESIEIGKHIHYYLETLDFKNPDFSVIDSKYKNKIIFFLNQDMLNDIEQSKIYKEYEFIYQNGDNELHGIIDLMLEFDDHIKIIDYKLKDINKKEYEDQLKGYQEYIKTISNKRVELYLYSIIDENYRKIQ